MWRQLSGFQKVNSSDYDLICSVSQKSHVGLFIALVNLILDFLAPNTVIAVTLV